MLLNIIQAPNRLLHKKTQNINIFDHRIKTLAENMFLTMYANYGCGLAAIQVSDDPMFTELKANNEYRAQPNIIVMKLENNEIIAINPSILFYSNKTDIDIEGCLSVPYMEANIKRSLSIKVKYNDVNGNIIETELHDLSARIFQHEFDHNQGILYPNRLNKLEELLFWKKYEKINN